uniref:Uncharacterized protein n=1 Tax=Emiliania huxleyi TaxID=2903 RepID=A0A6T0AVI1_EMIHU
MNVTLVPFGNAKYNGGVLTCQHGPNECTANSYEQCAIDEYPAFKVHFPYFTCLESAFLKGTEDIAATSAKCALRSLHLLFESHASPTNASPGARAPQRWTRPSSTRASRTRRAPPPCSASTSR